MANHSAGFLSGHKIRSEEDRKEEKRTSESVRGNTLHCLRLILGQSGCVIPCSYP